MTIFEDLKEAKSKALISNGGYLPSQSTKIITTGNPKIQKGEAMNWDTGIIHLAPSTISGIDVCPMATKGRQGCIWCCLNTAGRGGIGQFKKSKVHAARIGRTKLWFDDPDSFRAIFQNEVKSLLRKANKASRRLAIRPNGTSDLKDMANCLIDDCNLEFGYDEIMFYDYTKVPFTGGPWERPNYHLTFSWSGSSENALDCIRALDRGVNVAAMVETSCNIPEIDVAWIRVEANIGHCRERCFDIFDADKHDLRFLDQPRDGLGRVGLLKAKGKAKGSKFPGFAGRQVEGLVEDADVEFQGVSK